MPAASGYRNTHRNNHINGKRHSNFTDNGRDRRLGRHHRRSLLIRDDVGERLGLGRAHPPAADERHDDFLAYPGCLQAGQRRSVDVEDAAIHFDQREQHVVSEAGFGEIDDVLESDGAGGCRRQQDHHKRENGATHASSAPVG